MSATHTSVVTGAAGGREEDRMLMRKLEGAQHPSTLHTLRPQHIHAPRGTCVKRLGRLNAHTCTDATSQNPDSEGMKYTHTCPCANAYDSLSLTSAAPVAEDRLSTSYGREQHERTEVSERVDLFAAPPTFCGSPVQLSLISRE